MKSSGFRPLLIAAIICAALFLSIESISFLAGRLLISKWKMFGVPQPIDGSNEISLSAGRDPEVGWPGPGEYGGRTIDRTGSRRSPTFPDPVKQPSCVSFYGDSLIRGTEVEESEAMSELLSRRFGCRFASYGYGGYGTDQSLIRYKRNRMEAPQLVVLGFGSENIMRNLTRNRDLVSYHAAGAMKPRFVTDKQGGIKLIPRPQLTLEEYLRSVWRASPPLVLDHESFQPGGPAGATNLEFPFTLAVLRNLGDFRMKAFFAGEPAWKQFFEPEHRLQGLEVTASIMKRFTDIAKERGQKSLILLFPNPEDYEYFEKTGQWVSQPLEDALELAGIEVVALGPLFIKHLEGKPYRENDLFVPTGKGHYNILSNKLMADWLEPRIREMTSL